MKVGERVRRNFLMQVKSKQPVMGTLAITLMLLATAIIFIGIVPEKAEAAYSDYTYHKRITIESDYINNTLTNFPVLIHDNTGDLLGEVLTNGSDIAFFNATNETQYNHEIEWYNSTSGELWAWVNVTSIASETDTVCYMYYNDSDGGYPVGHNPTSVWDSNFLAVYHLNGTTDSTANGYDLINGGAVYVPDGNIAGCYAFSSGGGGDVMTQATLLDVWTEEVTWECLFYPTSGGVTQTVINKVNGPTHYVTIYEIASFFRHASTKTGGVAQACGSGVHPYSVSHSQWNYTAYTYKDNDFARLFGYDFVNKTVGHICTSGGITVLADGSTEDFSLGAGYGLTKDTPYDGMLDEVRISDVRRTQNWMNASFHSQNETHGFLTLGSQQKTKAASSFSIKGLPNDIITWSGTAGTSVWCNSSGDTNEWLEVNMSINVTDNVTEIRVWVGDLNDISAYINASNITVYVTNALNTTYYSFGTFTDGGSNITINQTTWNTYAGAIANPFNGAGLININTSIFLTFKLAIPADAPTDIFWSSASDAWKLYIGYHIT